MWNSVANQKLKLQVILKWWSKICGLRKKSITVFMRFQGIISIYDNVRISKRDFHYTDFYRFKQNFNCKNWCWASCEFIIKWFSVVFQLYSFGIRIWILYCSESWNSDFLLHLLVKIPISMSTRWKRYCHLWSLVSEKSHKYTFVHVTRTDSIFSCICRVSSLIRCIHIAPPAWAATSSQCGPTSLAYWSVCRPSCRCPFSSVIASGEGR